MYNHTIPLTHTPTQKNKLFVLKITIASWGAVIITSFSFSFFRSGFVSGLFVLKFLFFRSIYTFKKKNQLNITFVFLKNSIVNNNAKNESWKSNSRRGIIQNKECKGLVFSHFRLFLLSPFHDFYPFIYDFHPFIYVFNSVVNTKLPSSTISWVTFVLWGLVTLTGRKYTKYLGLCISVKKFLSAFTYSLLNLG